jgi:chromosome partitioning protein
MAVILIGGEKGGTGKTTTAVNLALMASIMGHDVMLVDATIAKQASSFKFINRRKEIGLKPTPHCVKIHGKYIHEELNSLDTRYETVIVDVGGADSVELRSAMAASCVTDMYSPFKPSDPDLETLQTMDEIVYLARSYNEKLNCRILLTQLPILMGSASTVSDAKELIKTYEYLSLATTVLCNRMSVQGAYGKGKAVVEYEEERRQNLPKYKVKDYLYQGSIEFCNLYKEVFQTAFSGANFLTLETYLNSKNRD